MHNDVVLQFCRERNNPYIKIEVPLFRTTPPPCPLIADADLPRPDVVDPGKFCDEKMHQGPRLAFLRRHFLLRQLWQWRDIQLRKLRLLCANPVSFRAYIVICQRRRSSRRERYCYRAVKANTNPHVLRARVFAESERRECQSYSPTVPAPTPIVRS